ncbi:MAG: glycoside hydrolase 100 family protein, partial [Bacteroidota bacterium]
MQFYELYKDARALLRRLTTTNGILASSIEAENYKRIWARDGIICGIAGLLTDDKIVIEGLRNTLTILAKNQHNLGIIPSNVLPEDTTANSYGSLTGRIDANTWFIIGACLYYTNTQDEKTWQKLQPALQKCRNYLKAIEFNANGWIYTPLSGNWADEYPVHGYTLYDNMLRFWGESLWEYIHDASSEKLQQIKEKTYINFWPQQEIPKHQIYQESAFNEVLKVAAPHFLAFILPGRYDRRFDAAGNALALLHFQLTSHQKTALSDFLNTLKHSTSRMVVPAFWPVIHEGDCDWEFIRNNSAFNFKNKPWHFHNGGIWPVWMGLFCLGLAKNKLLETVKE